MTDEGGPIHTAQVFSAWIFNFSTGFICLYLVPPSLYTLTDPGLCGTLILVTYRAKADDLELRHVQKPLDLQGCSIAP